MHELTEITSGLRFPEGPIAMPDGSVILVEIARQTLTRVMPDGKQHVRPDDLGIARRALDPDNYLLSVRCKANAFGAGAHSDALTIENFADCLRSILVLSGD